MTQLGKQPGAMMPATTAVAGHFLADPNCRHHVFIAEGTAADAILQLFQSQGCEINGRVIVVYAETRPDSAAYVSALSELPIEVLHALPSIVAAVSRVGSILACAPMNSRVYVAGCERLVSLMLQLAVACGRDAQTVMVWRQAAGAGSA